MKKVTEKMLLVVLMVIMVSASCSRDDDKPSVLVEPGDDPNFTIVANADGILKGFNRKVQVFGIDIYAVAGVSDANLLHAANVMAQYLDNDEDGVVDNQLVLDKMQENKAFVVMWGKESDLNASFPSGRLGQDLGNDETNPSYVSGGLKGRFDASIEEIWHIITHAGYAYAYPEVFGEGAGTDISNAMDIARGGRFTSIPNTYPENAWYSYDDATCEYDCQVTEYFYWAMSSILGAQATRLEEIGHEWKLNTPQKVKDTDKAVYELLTNATYQLPSVLPDGSYRH
ncbi:hypothetical protein [Carboxylicivirga sp. RSCT41]|uniref:hypothetical protein n=1 Tax=Carboxylicivirga agarovorans TaxID=3417570 RepID=UPI003D33FBC6